MNPDKSFGAWLKDFRKEHQLTQEELADKLSFSAEYIRKLETNRRPPTEGVIKRLADVLALRGNARDQFINFCHNEFSADRQHTQILADAQQPGGVALDFPPYKGLSYFDVADAHLYFGRRLLIKELVSLLAEPKLERSYFLALVGASGSGKSSLVRAGLIPTLQQGQLSDQGLDAPLGSEQWLYYVITPTAYPLESLATTITQTSASVIATATLVDDLRQDFRTLHLYARRIVVADQRLFLVVDQFEELFTLCKDRQERAAFIANLCYAAKQDGFITVVLTVRADFYRHCLGYDQLRLLLDHHTKTVGPLNYEELRCAIVCPAEAYGWQFEEGLVNLLLDDVSTEPGALPLLAHALRETWDRREGRTMTLAGYMAIGRVQGAIATTATRIYSGLNDAQKRVAKRLFLRLTELGEGSEDTRRRVPLAELLSTAGEQQNVAYTLKILADARLIATDDEAVEVAHEALIREWPLLRTWLDDNREGLRLHRRLTTSTYEWQALGHDEGVLYRGARLEQVLAWVQEHPDEISEQEQAFLAASQAAVAAAQKAEAEAHQRDVAQQRLLAEQEAKRAELAELRAKEAAAFAKVQAAAARRLQTARNVLTAISGLALFLALLAGRFGQEANHHAAVALTNQNIAEARATVAVAAQATAVVSARLADTERLAVQARMLSESKDPKDLDVALLIARHVVTTTLWSDGYVLANAELALTEAIDAVQRNQWREVLALPHTTTLRAIVYSPDGQLLVSAGEEPIIYLWDIQTGAEVRRLTRHTGPIHMVTFSADGQSIISASEDRTARVWDVASGVERYQLVGHTGGVTAAKFSPDGQKIVTASADQTIRIWNVISRQEIRQLPGHGGLIWAAEFSPNGQQIVSAGADKTVRIWEVATGQEVHRQQIGFKDDVTWAVFSPDRQQILSASVDGRVRIWNVTSGNGLHAFYGDTTTIRSALFSPNGSQMMGTTGEAVRIWNVTSEREVWQPITHAGVISIVAGSPTGHQIATGSEDGRIRVWEAGTIQHIYQLCGHEASVRMATFSGDGQQIVSAGEDATVRIWDVNNGQPIRQLTGHGASVRTAMFSPDGQKVVSASQDNTVWIWDVKSGQPIRQLTGHDGSVWWAAFSPDGQRIVSGGQDSTIRIWDAVGGTEVGQLLGHEQSVWSVAYRPDGRQIVSAGEDATIRLWDLNSGKEVKQLTGHVASVWYASFSPDGQWLVSAGDDGTVRLWDVASGREVRQLVGHTGGVRSALFSTDGRQIVSASADKTVRLWDVASGREMRQLVGHTERVLFAAYSPDGKQLLSTSADTTIRLWTASIEVLLEQAQALILREPPTLTAGEQKFYGIK